MPPTSAGARDPAIDLLAIMAVAGFATEPRAPGDTPLTVVGDPATWGRIGTLCRGYLLGQHPVAAAPAARLGKVAAGRLPLELWTPDLDAGDGTGHLTLELARRLAAREGADLTLAAAATIVILVPGIPSSSR